MWWDSQVVRAFVWYKSQVPWGLTHPMSSTIRLHLSLVAGIRRREAVDTGRDPGLAAAPLPIKTPPIRTAAGPPVLQSIESATDTRPLLASNRASRTGVPVASSVARDGVALSGECGGTPLHRPPSRTPSPRRRTRKAAVAVASIARLQGARSVGSVPDQVGAPARTRPTGVAAAKTEPISDVGPRYGSSVAPPPRVV